MTLPSNILVKKVRNMSQNMVNYHNKWIGSLLEPYQYFVTLYGQDSADPLEDK